MENGSKSNKLCSTFIRHTRVGNPRQGLFTSAFCPQSQVKKDPKFSIKIILTILKQSFAFFKWIKYWSELFFRGSLLPINQLFLYNLFKNIAASFIMLHFLLLTPLEQKMVIIYWTIGLQSSFRHLFLCNLAPKLLTTTFFKEIQTFIMEYGIGQFLHTRCQKKRYDFFTEFV